MAGITDIVRNGHETGSRNVPVVTVETLLPDVIKADNPRAKKLLEALSEFELTPRSHVEGGQSLNARIRFAWQSEICVVAQTYDAQDVHLVQFLSSLLFQNNILPELSPKTLIRAFLLNTDSVTYRNSEFMVKAAKYVNDQLEARFGYNGVDVLSFEYTPWKMGNGKCVCACAKV
jgi:hypothetical protein